MRTYPVHEIENQPHGDAKLLKVQTPVVIDVGQVPDSFELVVSQLAVFEDRCGLRAVEVRAAIGEGGEDLPVSFDFPLFDFVVGHC